MRLLARIGAALIAVLPACPAQTANRKSKPEPKPEATAPELFEYVRSALLLLTPDDGINDNVEVSYNWEKNVMTIAQPGGHCDLFLNALNTNDLAWDIFDPSDTQQMRDKLLRLTLVSVSETKARICYDKMNQVDESAPTNRIPAVIFAQQGRPVARLPGQDGQGDQAAHRPPGRRAAKGTLPTKSLIARQQIRRCAASR